MNATDKTDAYNRCLDIVNSIFAIFREVEHDLEPSDSEIKKIFLDSGIFEHILKLYNNTMTLLGLENIDKLELLGSQYENEKGLFIQNMLGKKEDKDSRPSEYYHANFNAFFYIVNDFVSSIKTRVEQLPIQNDEDTSKTRVEQLTAQNDENTFYINSGLCQGKNILQEFFGHYLDLLGDYMKSNGIHPSRVTISNCNKGSFEIRGAIQYVLYDRTLLMTVNDYAKYSSIFLIRSYIESMIIDNFPDKDSSHGTILNILKDEKEEIMKLDRGDEIYQLCNTFLIINRWANSFVHEHNIPLSWQMYLVKKYIDSTQDLLQDINLKYSNELTLYPTIIPLESEVYNTINLKIR